MDNTSFTDAFPIKTLNKKSNPICHVDYWLHLITSPRCFHEIPWHSHWSSRLCVAFKAKLWASRMRPSNSSCRSCAWESDDLCHHHSWWKKQRFNGCWLNTNTAVTSIFNIFLTFLSICWFHRLWNFWLQTPSCSKPRISIFGFGFIGPAFSKDVAYFTSFDPESFTHRHYPTISRPVY